MGAVRYRTQGRTSPTIKGRMMKTVTYEGTNLVGISADDVLVTAHKPDGKMDYLKLTELLDNMMIRISNLEQSVND